MAGRASIVGAAVSDVGRVRSHNEDSHYFDAENGVFVVCDGMGGHAAGEVASALAVQVLRKWWTSNEVLDSASRWLVKGTPEARKALLDTIRQGVVAAHDAIVDEAKADEAKTGMGTTLVGAMVVGGDCVFAHAGDSRAYLVRDGIAMQLTEDHTLMARLMAAGVDVDTTGEGARFKSMLTNALGIGQECKVSTFVVPLADGDRFLLCSDGVSEYIKESEVGEVLTKQPSPARAAQKLVDLALERGGADNATALVVRVLEAGDTPQSAAMRNRDDESIKKCLLFAKLSPQQCLRATRIGLPRDHMPGEKIPANTLGDRVAWLVLEGTVEQDGEQHGPGTLLYPEALAGDRPLPDRDGLAMARTDVRALAMRSDDFRELCEDDDELGEVLLDGLTGLLAARLKRPGRNVVMVSSDADPRAITDPNIRVQRMPSDPGAEVDVPVVVTDKPMVTFHDAQTVPRMPKMLAQRKSVDSIAVPVVAPPEPEAVPQAVVAEPAEVVAPAPAPAPPVVAAEAPEKKAKPSEKEVTKTMQLPIVDKLPARPASVVVTPPAGMPAVGRTPTPIPGLPKLPPKLPSVPKPAGAAAGPPSIPLPPVAKPPARPIELEDDEEDHSATMPIVPPKLTAAPEEVVTELDSGAIEIDVDEAAPSDEPKTFVGPPPVDDEDAATLLQPPIEDKDTVTLVPEPPLKKPITSEHAAVTSGTIDNEHLDVHPDDVAAIEAKKRKKRLTEGWDD